MDIMQIWGAYQKDADPETIFPMYQECALNAKAVGYGDANLLYIASQNAHPEAVVWLLEQGLKPNEASGYGELPLFLLARKGFSCGYLPRKGDIYRTAQALLDGGGNVLRRDSDGRFCYHHAAQASNVEFLRALAERGVKLNNLRHGLSATGVALCIHPLLVDVVMTQQILRQSDRLLSGSLPPVAELRGSHNHVIVIIQRLKSKVLAI